MFAEAYKQGELFYLTKLASKMPHFNKGLRDLVYALKISNSSGNTRAMVRDYYTKKLPPRIAEDTKLHLELLESLGKSQRKTVRDIIQANKEISQRMRAAS